MEPARPSLWILAALVSVGASFLAATRLAPRAGAAAPVDPSTASGGAPVAELSRRLSALAAGTEELRETLAAYQADGAGRAAPPPTTPTAQEIETAVESWLARRLATVEASARLARSDSPYADLAASDFLRLLTESDADGAERQLLWQAAREAGEAAALLALFEERVAASPEDAGLCNDLAQAYLQMRYGETDTTRGQEWARRADDEFARVLELDPDHWDARFSKARALSMWPAMLGRTGEAIQDLERLVATPPSPSQTDRADVYLTLGNLRLRTGDRAGALEAWREGAALFPSNEELRAQIAYAEGR